MKVKPLHDRIVIKRVEEKETIKGGIIIPDTAKEKPQEGEVIAVGGGKKTEEGKVIPMDVKAGDRILFGKYSGTEIKIDDEEYLIIREDEVLGIIEAAKQSASGGKKYPGLMARRGVPQGTKCRANDKGLDNVRDPSDDGAEPKIRRE